MSLPKEKLIKESEIFSSCAAQVDQLTGAERLASQLPIGTESGAQRRWVAPCVESLGKVADMTLSATWNSKGAA
jgi:hypothetical protein